MEDVKRKSPLQEGIFINTMTTAVTYRNYRKRHPLHQLGQALPYYFAATLQ
ncbi:MAG: hypothetical protein M5U34_33785 [Chloroflexi bacterium]|nr:hypothetical protein [Chloroflexota bacterium]